MKTPVNFKSVLTPNVEYDIHGASIKRLVSSEVEKLVIKRRGEEEIFIALYFEDGEHLTLFVRPKVRNGKQLMVLGIHEDSEGVET